MGALGADEEALPPSLQCRYECFNFEDVIFIRRGDCKTPTLLNVIMVVVELVRGPMIEARVD